VIEYSNAIAISFLSLFGIEEGNGLSTFVTNIAKPLDLKGLISQFFKPLKQDNRGGGAVMTGSTANIDANNITPDQVDNNSNEVNNNGKDEDNNVMDTATALLPEMIALHVSFINICTRESVTDHVSNNDNDSIQDEDKHECEDPLILTTDRLLCLRLTGTPTLPKCRPGANMALINNPRI
jgi:hypothetical protein